MCSLSETFIWHAVGSEVSRQLNFNENLKVGKIKLTYVCVTKHEKSTLPSRTPIFSSFLNATCFSVRIFHFTQDMDML